MASFLKGSYPLERIEIVMSVMKKRNLLFGLLALELATLPFAIPAAAQIIDRIMPGPASNCATAVSLDPSVIYRASQKTALRKGPILSQAVIAEISYDVNLTPDFIVKTQDSSKKFAEASRCEFGDS